MAELRLRSVGLLYLELLLFTAGGGGCFSVLFSHFQQCWELARAVGRASGTTLPPAPAAPAIVSRIIKLERLFLLMSQKPKSR